MLNPSDISSEITESLAMLDREFSIKRLYQFKEVGFKITIDNFGLCYFSLSDISDIPVDIMKLLRYFLNVLNK